MNHSLENEIERLRGLMVETASQKGINDPEVITISQMIDSLHVEYIKKQKDKKYRLTVIKEKIFEYIGAKCC